MTQEKNEPVKPRKSVQLKTKMTLSKLVKGTLFEVENSLEEEEIIDSPNSDKNIEFDVEYLMLTKK